MTLLLFSQLLPPRLLLLADPQAQLPSVIGWMATEERSPWMDAQPATIGALTTLLLTARAAAQALLLSLFVISVLPEIAHP